MTAQNTNDPPMTVAIAGNSAKTSHAKSGASGVSKTLGLIHNSGLTFQAQFPQPIPVTLF
jgi:hypothetical protein